MKIVKFFGDPHSSREGHALIEIEPGEIPDIDEMVTALDGVIAGNFGIRITLISCTKDVNEIKIKTAHDGNIVMEIGAECDFGFPPVREQKKVKRIYEVMVYRD